MKKYLVTDRPDIDSDGQVFDDLKEARAYFERMDLSLQWRCRYETSGKMDKGKIEWSLAEFDETGDARIINRKSYGYGDFLREAER